MFAYKSIRRTPQARRAALQDAVDNLKSKSGRQDNLTLEEINPSDARNRSHRFIIYQTLTFYELWDIRIMSQGVHYTACFLSQQVYHFTSLPLQRVVRLEYDFLLVPSKLYHGYGCSFIDSSEYCSKSLVNFFAIVWSRAKVTVSSIKTTFLLFLVVICSDHHVRDNRVLLGTLTIEKSNPAVKSHLISQSALLSRTSTSVLVDFSGFFKRLEKKIILQ